MDINRTNSTNNIGSYFPQQAGSFQPGTIANSADYGAVYGFTIQDLATPMDVHIQQPPSMKVLQQVVKNPAQAASLAAAMKQCASPTAGLSGFHGMLRYFTDPTQLATEVPQQKVQPTSVNPTPVMVEKVQTTPVSGQQVTSGGATPHIMPPKFTPTQVNDPMGMQQGMGSSMGIPPGQSMGMGAPMGMGTPMGAPMGAGSLPPDMPVSQKIASLYQNITMLLQQQSALRDSIHAKKQQVSDGNMGRILHTEDPGATRSRNEGLRSGITMDEMQLSNLKMEVRRIEAQIVELKKFQR